MAETVNEPALSDRVPMVKLIVGDTAVMLYVPIITGLSANPGALAKALTVSETALALMGPVYIVEEWLGWEPSTV